MNKYEQQIRKLEQNFWRIIREQSVWSVGT